MSTSQPTKHIKERSARPIHSQNGISETQSSNKNQPTGEQLRIAQITSDRSDVDPEMLKKIKEVSDLTGRSNDEAWTALHDCNGDINQAVDLLFEKKAGDQDEWQEKKKKKKVAVTNRAATSDTTSCDTKPERTDGETEKSENIPRAQRDRAIPRFQRGRGRGYNHTANGEKDVSSASRERGPERRFEGGRGRRGGRGGAGGGGGRNRGGRGFNSNTSLESVPHIDTWTNETAQNGKNDTTIGAWGEMNEEWTADEWSGSLEETLVLTRTMPTRPDVFSAAADSSSNSQTLQSQVFVPSSSSSSAANIGEALTHNMGSAATGYRPTTMTQNTDQNSRPVGGFDLNHLLPKFSESYSMTQEDESNYLSHFTKEATECIKNAVGIGSSSENRHAAGMDQLGRSASQLNTAQVPLPNRMKQQQQQQPQRPRLPPPSKIPSSAVEMPGSMGNAQLDVQFGNWDVPPSSTTEVSNFLKDSSQTSQYAPSGTSVQQQSALSSLVGTSGKALADLPLHKSNMGLPLSESSSQSAVLSLQDMAGLSSKSSAYQTNSVQQQDLVNSNKMASPPQLLPYPSSSDDRKTIPYSSQQPTSQLPGQGSMSSQLGLSQLAYSSGVESASSVYKPPSVASGASAYSQPIISQQHSVPVSAVAAGANANVVPYTSSLHYPSAGPQAMHTNYPVALTQPTYSYGTGVAQQSYSNTPASYNAMATQAAFSGTSKSYNAASEKQQGSFPSALSQVYESNSMVNTYPAGNQSGVAGMPMAYQSSGAAMYHGGQAVVGLSYDGLPAVSSGGTYQHPANLYRAAGQMAVNMNDFHQTGIPESSFPRSTQVVVSTATTPSKLMDGLNKLSVKDTSGSAVSQQYDATTISSSLTAASSASNATAGIVMISATNSSHKTSTVTATPKSTVSSKAAVNWPPGVPTPMVNLNPNYMISQPPGFQLATFGYPTAQQTMPYSFEDVQILQQRGFALQPTAYYDMPLPAGNAALPGRDMTAALTTSSYVAAGNDVKLAAPMEPQVSAVQQSQQVQVSGANQQSYPTATLHHYSYFYPGAPGIMPMGSYYTPMIPMGGVVSMNDASAHAAAAWQSEYDCLAFSMADDESAVPMATNPTHGVTTSSTQYQKPALYGSHTFGAGGQSQDFSKTFNPQVSVKATGSTAGVNPNDMGVSANAFGKSHVQGFDKVGFHSGTPPPTSFSLALGSGTQAGALGQPAIYGAPYMPLMPHQSHSQIMQHAMAAQDSAGRAAAQPNTAQAKVVSNKTYNPYWATGN